MLVPLTENREIERSWLTELTPIYRLLPGKIFRKNSSTSSGRIFRLLTSNLPTTLPNLPGTRPSVPSTRFDTFRGVLNVNKYLIKFANHFSIWRHQKGTKFTRRIIFREQFSCKITGKIEYETIKEYLSVECQRFPRQNSVIQHLHTFN